MVIGIALPFSLSGQTSFTIIIALYTTYWFYGVLLVHVFVFYFYFKINVYMYRF